MGLEVRALGVGRTRQAVDPLETVQTRLAPAAARIGAWGGGLDANVTGR